VKEGWNVKQLSDFMNIQSGFSFKSGEYTDSGHFLVRIGNVQDGYLALENPKYVSLDRTTVRFELQEGDFLTSLTGNIGRVARVENFHLPAALNQRVARLTVRNQTTVNKDYVFYILSSNFFKKALSSIGHGAAQQNVSPNAIGHIKVPLPPLPEQKRIVAILDEAFEGIGAAVAFAEKNLVNARELFEIYRNSIFTQKGEGWVEKKLGDIAIFKNGLNFTKSSKGELIKIVGVKDFQKNFSVPVDQLETAQIDGKLGADYELKAGDILTVRSNGNKQLIGRCILANDLPEKTSHSGFTIRIRVASKDITPEYLVHFLKSKTSREMLIESGDGANISSLNQQALSALPVSVPPHKDQLAIVQKIEAIDTESKRLETIYQQKLANFAELKQSILQKAFAGELTARPEQALQEAVA
jgi:type I restriction enzyme S subunit